MFTPTRAEARRFFFDTWARYRRGDRMESLETVALRVIVAHPEYHPLLDDPESHLEREYGPEGGDMNPFLHLSLHLAVEEQLAIDQPAGICGRYQRLVQAAGSEHGAKHVLLECLGETLWQAQRDGRAPDDRFYIECLDRHTGAHSRT